MAEAVENARGGGVERALGMKGQHHHHQERLLLRDRLFGTNKIRLKTRVFSRCFLLNSDDAVDEEARNLILHWAVRRNEKLVFNVNEMLRRRDGVLQSKSEQKRRRNTRLSQTKQKTKEGTKRVFLA